MNLRHGNLAGFSWIILEQEDSAWRRRFLHEDPDFLAEKNQNTEAQRSQSQEESFVMSFLCELCASVVLFE
jgi:3-methyladenine DNA glycosylase Tag